MTVAALSGRPRIAVRELARRRRELMALMGEGCIAILPSAQRVVRNRDVHYPFRQDSDFHYLSGFDEPDAVLVLVPGRQHGQYLLFCRERDPERENWEGPCAGPEGACARFGADDAFPVGDLDDILPGLIEGRERLYYTMGRQPGFDRQLLNWINGIRARARSGARPPGEFLDLDHCLHELRLFKSVGELRVMRHAATISAGAHLRAMRACRPGMFEYELEAELLHEFLRHGARAPAYSSIVAGGANGCILHYTTNDAPLRAGELVLVDAGCEFEHYAADITRTFPVSGRFSAAQQALYELVLAAQLAAIREIAPGRHWNEPHDVAVRVITEGLRDLGLLDGEAAELVEQQAWRHFYMQRTGHWLGLDVHDVGDYKVGGAWRVLEPGMVLTVEPGIYVAPDNREVAPKWRGIAIRIEDAVAVTRSGHDVLSAAAPKTVDDIAYVMAGSA
ncbi:MAG: Xaa-Pro aminopeptidase [Pseudomonadales bacterium]|jgi:Xaa-Pro aminopeptidase|nr:Xaa-Pro aminopeptidase [Pseudomonadales bacterium]MCP5321015.1 Xaa-Pro aminopeptidase [Pseudomonadales bacterium]MCP5337379.1 Xaa-Pro aminopeptidase [Pseudomonadales bacterium]